MGSVKFSHRVALILMLVLVVAAGVLLSAVYLVHVSGQQTKLLYDHPLTVSNAVRDINIHINAIHRNMKDVALAETPEQIHEAVAKVELSDEAIHESFAIVAERFLGTKEKILEVYSAYNQWEPIRAEVIALKLAGSDIEATRITKGKGAEHVELLFRQTKELTDFAQNKADTFYRATEQNTERSLLLFGGGIGLLILMSSVSIYFLSRSITRPISEFIEEMGTILEREGPMNLKYAEMPEEQIFEAALLELKSAYSQLKDYNEELDSRVKERTLELTEREAELRRSNEEFRELNERFKAQNENLAEAMKKAEESEQLKSAFLANMSHEIRTPMNAILGFSELIEMGDLEADEHDDFLRQIRRSGEQLLRLISDIVDLSKIDANQLSIIPSPVCVKGLLDGVYKQFSIYVKEGGPELILTYSPDSDVTALLDEQRLTQILSNLMENAFKHTRVGKIELGCRRDGPELEFRVTDTGPGIPKEAQQKIFERFHQLDGPDGKFRAGTGLGLAICKSLSELMGGSIGLNSELGAGTSFFIRVPFEPSEFLEGGPKAEWREAGAGGGCTILVAEDEPANRTFIQAMLARHEFKVVTVENGLEAVERIESGFRPDIILMDIKMPIMDGYEATTKIKMVAPAIPVIAQTAYAMADDRQSAISSGFDDYVSKPISAEDLVSKILHLIRVEVNSDSATN